MKLKQLKEMINYNFSILKERKYKETAIGSVLLLIAFFSFLYGMFKIPVLGIGIVRMSPITLLDIIYIVIASTLTGILIALLRYKISTSVATKGAGIGGFIVGFFGAVCPTCQTISLAAFGSTVAALPLGFLVPYINIIRSFSLLFLSYSVYLTANTIYTKTCPTYALPRKIKEVKLHSYNEPPITENKFALGLLVALVVMLLVNQFFTMNVFASLVPSTGGTTSIGSGELKLEYGTKRTLKPMPLAVGEQPVISGYKSKVKSLPTISDLTITPSTGNLEQDLINNVLPRGTPWYGGEAGVSFDDPITAQQLWGRARSIQLDAMQEERWNRIVNSFTCDYCCGSPQQPTIITRCGCAHSLAAQGMARWFIKNYGDKYSDEEIYGEMARWYALWYPGPTVQRIIQEATA